MEAKQTIPPFSPRPILGPPVSQPYLQLSHQEQLSALAGTSEMEEYLDASLEQQHKIILSSLACITKLFSQFLPSIMLLVMPPDCRKIPQNLPFKFFKMKSLNTMEQLKW